MTHLIHRYILACSPLPEILKAVQDTVDDLAYTHVGQWSPFELTLLVPLHLSDSAPSAAQTALTRWLSNRGIAWVMLGTRRADARLTVRCRKVGA